MKKISMILLSFIIVFSLGACNSNSKLETATYVAEIDGANLEAVFTHKDDQLKKVEQKMIYPFSYLGLEEGIELDEETEQQLKDEVSTQFAGFKDGEGTSLETEFTDKALKMTLSIDLEKADETAIYSLIGNTGDVKNVSFKKTIEDFEKMGFKEK